MNTGNMAENQKMPVVADLCEVLKNKGETELSNRLMEAVAIIKPIKTSPEPVMPELIEKLIMFRNPEIALQIYCNSITELQNLSQTNNWLKMHHMPMKRRH